MTRKRDRQSGNFYPPIYALFINESKGIFLGLDSVKFSLTRKQKMSIDGIFFTVFNIVLHCNTSITPWCDCSGAPKELQSKKNLVRDKDVIVPIMKKVKERRRT